MARHIDPEVKINNSVSNSYFYRNSTNFLASLPDINSVYILFYRVSGEYYKQDYASAIAHWDRAFAQDPSLLQAEIGEALGPTRSAAGMPRVSVCCGGPKVRSMRAALPTPRAFTK